MKTVREQHQDTMKDFIETCNMTPLEIRSDYSSRVDFSPLSRDDVAIEHLNDTDALAITTETFDRAQHGDNSSGNSHSIRMDVEVLIQNQSQRKVLQRDMHAPFASLHANQKKTKQASRGWGFRTLKRRVATCLQRSRFHGWRMGVLIGSCLSAFVLFCNIILVAVGCRTHGGFHGGFATLRTGDTSDISRASIIAHLLINACSTMLLAASSYTMQVLSSPTRDEVDSQHHKGRWLDIGLLSFSNLRIISRQRLRVCVILMLSSIPLHVL